MLWLTIGTRTIKIKKIIGTKNIENCLGTTSKFYKKSLRTKT